jgi:phosphocarrier protein FPr/phosphocarrier protein
LILLAPLPGWATPLEEVPDEVFAGRLLGDGVAIDPTGGTLHAPCDGEVIAAPASKHALTLRATAGVEILMHVGIDTVAMEGEGFEMHVAPGQRVHAGDRLLTFDLDLVARRAKSLLTPILVLDGAGPKITSRQQGRAVEVGEPLLELALAPPGVQPANPLHVSAARVMPVKLEHGIHARPAALLVRSLKPYSADVVVAAHGREASARSAVALMSLGVRHGDVIEVRAAGADAGPALAALEEALARGAKALPASRRSAQLHRASQPASPRVSLEGGPLAGVVASPGLAVGVAVHLSRSTVRVSEVGLGVTRESAELERALGAVRARLAETMGSQQGVAHDIAEAHEMLLDDPELLARAQAFIAQGSSAGHAWRQSIQASIEVLRGLDDERLRERADDLTDLESQVLAALAPGGDASRELPPDAILIARELLPSQLLGLDSSRLKGICLAGGGPTSHVAILAAARGLPALVALGPQVLEVPEATPLVLDGKAGLLEVNPGAARLEAARVSLKARQAQEVDALTGECRTSDGERIVLLANIGSLEEAGAAVRQGAEGCGLLRTELLFLDRAAAPDEAEQLACYQQIARALEGRPLTIRTLDAGGDKPIPYLPLPPEDNPALGLRGVRTSLAYPQLLAVQLAAILAVEPAGQCRILLPMINDVSEIRAVRKMIDEACQKSGRTRATEVGVMIETPAAALTADRLAAEADFFSIGTNDLTQYTLAMDRGHPQLAGRLDGLHPAVLRLIAATVQAARARGRRVSVCGGLASDLVAVPVLLGLGVHELSAVAAVIPQLKARIARTSIKECRELAQEALEAETAQAVRALALGGLSPVATP